MDVIFAVAVFIGVLLIYFAPSIIASGRNAKSVAGIAILNIFLGWTFLGWLGALIWSVSGESEETDDGLTRNEREIALAAARAVKDQGTLGDSPSDESTADRGLHQVNRDERGRIVID
jgi:hypothetical protein